MDVIDLEWRVRTLELRGLPLEAMDRDDRLAVLTHYYKRHGGRELDATTSEPATPRDLLAVQAAIHGKKRGSGESDAHAEGMRRLEELREQAAARRGHGH